MTKWKQIVLCMSLSASFLPVSFVEIHGEEGYTVKDAASSEEGETYTDWDDARAAFEDSLDTCDNAEILYGDTVMAAEYAVASFHGTDACDVNLDYVDENGNAGYLNACYGRDGAYIGTSEDGKTVQAEISGVIGTFDIDDVDLIPLDALSVTTSSYIVSEGKLYHRIKSEMDDDYYAASIDLGKAPDDLKEDVSYSSYDGHYFYGDLRDLLKDLKEGSHGRAVNEAPYYCYFQFLPHRSLTRYSQKELQEYLENEQLLDASPVCYEDRSQDSVNDILNRSQFYGTVPAFLGYQSEYGANALMMLALAGNESAMGRSALSYTRNNLFGHAAYDSDVEANAKRYLDPEHSILGHARHYISGSYADPSKSMYHGSFFGNKSSGMSVSYASDPYWGEKAAAYMTRYDEDLGGKDDHAYSLGIRTSASPLTIYRDPDHKDVLYRGSEGKDYSVLILGESGEDYIIQADPASSNDDTYDFEEDIGYVRKSDLDVILPAKNRSAVSYVRVTFDGDGGRSADGKKKVTLSIPKGTVPSFPAPEKKGSVFTGWDSEPARADKDMTYTAAYRKVDSIAMESIPKDSYLTGEFPDLQDGSILVRYADEETETVPLSLSMISGYDLSRTGEQMVTVTYAGLTTEYPITIEEGIGEETRQKTAEDLEAVLYSYGNKTSFSRYETNDIDTLRQKILAEGSDDITDSQYRQYDSLLRKRDADTSGYAVRLTEDDLQITGMSAAIDPASLKKPFLAKNFIEASFEEDLDEEEMDRLEAEAGVNDESTVRAGRLQVEANGKDVQLKGRLLVSVAKPQEEENLVYSAYQLADNGDVIRLPLDETEGRIIVSAERSGCILITSKQSANEYSGTDPIETVTMENSDHGPTAGRYLIYGAAILFVLALSGLIVHSARRKTTKKPQKKTGQSDVKTETDPQEETGSEKNDDQHDRETGTDQVSDEGSGEPDGKHS